MATMSFEQVQRFIFLAKKIIKKIYNVGWFSERRLLLVFFLSDHKINL